MNPFNAHPRRQGVTYVSHFMFAMGIAMRLFHSVIVFASHAIFPFIEIRRSLDLEATTDYLQERNAWIENRKQLTRQRSVSAIHYAAALLEYSTVKSKGDER